MKNALEALLEAIRSRREHLVVISGNVYDTLRLAGWQFADLEDFLLKITKPFPQFVTYDLFAGVKVLRGDEEKIIAAMGLIEKKPSNNDPNADLLNALKQAKMANGSSSKFPINPLELFPALNKLLKESKVPLCMVFNYADAMVPKQLQNVGSKSDRVPSIALTTWARSSKIRENGHLLVLVTRSATDLDETVIDRTFESVQIRIPKPNEEERIAFLKEQKLKESVAASLGKVTAGLSLKDIGKVCFSKGAPTDLESLLPRVFSFKQTILKDEYADLLEVMETRNGFDAIGGLEKPTAKLCAIARAMREGKTTLVPQGILFMGPPGTGKTVEAEAFAKEAGLNFVKPRDIKSLWLGESERRMTRFIDAVRDLAPVVVFIDEFDQNQSQRGGFDGDSGTSRGLFKKMLEVMSDTSLRGRVLWIMATNRPDLIDPAMKRPGRCDLRIPFLSPDARELALICKAAFTQYPEIRSGIREWTPYAEKCKNYSGADMIEVIRRAWEHAVYDSRETIANVDMEWAIGDYRPQILDQEQAARMTLLALAECSSMSLLPDNWEAARDRALGNPVTEKEMELAKGVRAPIDPTLN